MSRSSLRPDSAGRLLSPAGGVRAGIRLEGVAQPDQRLVSLWTDADRAKAAEVDAEAAKVREERSRQADRVPGRSAREGTGRNSPRSSATSCAKPIKPRPTSAPTSKSNCLAMNPSVSDISPGMLYQYNPMAAEELKKIDARIAEDRGQKAVPGFHPGAQRSARPGTRHVPVPSRRSEPAPRRDRPGWTHGLFSAGRAAGDRPERPRASLHRAGGWRWPVGSRAPAIRSRLG